MRDLLRRISTLIATNGRPVLLASFVVALGSAPVSLKSLPIASQEKPVFRAGIDLVTLDVTVLDGAGKPLPGLTADDFVVTLSGRRQPVHGLEFIRFGSSSGAAVDPIADAGSRTNQSNEAGQAGRGGRVIVLLFDDLGARPGEARSLTVAAERMLASLDSADLVGIATTSGLGPVLAPTRDRVALLAMLSSKRLVGRFDDSSAPFVITAKEAIEIARSNRDTKRYVIQRECNLTRIGDQCPSMVEQTAGRMSDEARHRVSAQLRAYGDIIRALGFAPKPRVLIALSSGVALEADPGHRADLDAVKKEAALAQIQFYGLTEVVDLADVRDVEGNDLPIHSRRYARVAENGFLIDGLQAVARSLGGEAFKVIGQADRFFTRVLQETSGVYRLLIQVPTPASPADWQDLKVSTTRANVTVRSRPDIPDSPRSGDARSVDDQLRTRLTQGGVAFGVPVSLATGLRRGAGKTQMQLSCELSVPANVAGPLKMMFALINPSGTVMQSGRRELMPPASGVDYRPTFSMPVAEGRYRLRVAVADAQGNIGSLDAIVTAELQTLGDLKTSDLLMAWAGADGAPRFAALEALPGDVGRLQVILEIYPDSRRAMPTSLRFSLSKSDVAGGGLPTDVIAQTERPLTESGENRSAMADFAMGDLAAGTYYLHATVLDRNVPLGTVSRRIIKR